MSASLNKVFLMGNLTRDPEVRALPSGDKVAEFGLAMSEQYRSKATNEIKESVTFVDVSVWGRSAENCGQYLAKGRPVFIEGRLVLDQWEDKEGKKRSRLRVRADRVQFLPSAQRPDGATPQGSPSTPMSNTSMTPAYQTAPAAPAYAPSQPPTADDGDLDDLPF